MDFSTENLENYLKLPQNYLKTPQTTIPIISSQSFEVQTRNNTKNKKNKINRTDEQLLFEKEIGKWLKKTRLSKSKINPLTGRTMVVTQSKLAKHLGVTFQQVQKYSFLNLLPFELPKHTFLDALQRHLVDFHHF